MTRPADAERRTGRPIVVEIAGVAGAGKSTLAASLAASLSALGYAASDSRSTRRQSFGARERISAWLRAFPESATATAFVAGRVVRRHLPPAALSRLGPAFQHSRQLQLLVPRLGATGVIVQEPGWLMDLLTQFVHASRPLDVPTAQRYVGKGPAIDFAIVLRASPEVALRHMNARKRGLPQSFRALDAPVLDEMLRRADASGGMIAGACRAAGIETLELEVDALDAAAVTSRCTEFLVTRLTNVR